MQAQHWQNIQHSVSALYLRVQDNGEGRRECKAITKKSNDSANIIKLLKFFH